jgi:membrane-bound lytic murein transglycosylase B
MNMRIRCVLLAVLFCINLPLAADTPYTQRAEVREFINHMVSEHGLDRPWLEETLGAVRTQQSVLDAIARPAEHRPWHEYRPIFLTDQRIRDGATFWAQHETIIRRASQEFGVDPEIIVAIIGVETFYGRRMGNHPVLDSLVTLAFDYPPRARFFRSELEHLFLLAAEEELDVTALRGSYAGAMGAGQFISSSYRHYAVDFSGSGNRDLFADWEDAIGSVANYFRRHGWDKGGPVAVPAVLRGNGDNSIDTGLRQRRAGELREAGLVFSDGIANDERVLAVALDTGNGTDWWVGLENFWVITRYNRSPLYAMAVWELSREIRQLRDA